MRRVKKIIPSRKYLVGGLLNFISVYIIYIILYDILGQPAWLWTPIVSVIMFFLRYNLENHWVFKKKV